MGFTQVVPKTCCVKPAVKLFPMASLTAATKTCRANSRLMSWANVYKINGLQKQGITNLIDITDPATSKIY